jgi:hypothetical protein
VPADNAPARLAYADPPYPRQARKWYAEHPDYAGEVDHAALVAQLAGYDGWALSTGAYAIQEVLALCPSAVRVGVWNCTNTQPPGNRGAWWWSWEAVIVSPARQPNVVTRDLLACASPRGFLGGTVAGQKPPEFCAWVFAIMGARPGDELADLFPGSGAVGRAWSSWSSQLAVVSEPVDQLTLRDAPFRSQGRTLPKVAAGVAHADNGVSRISPLRPPS